MAMILLNMQQVKINDTI